MSYIYPAPGVANVEATLTLEVASETTDVGLLIPAMQDITVNNANDVFTWTQLDRGSKFQIATTSTNDISINVVIDQAAFFGDSTLGATHFAGKLGIFGLSKNKTKVAFSLYLGDTDAGANGKTISGEGYITGLSPTVSADSPVWVTPVTISVTGDYTVA